MTTDLQPALGFDPVSGQTLPPAQPAPPEKQLLAPVWHTVVIVGVVLANSYMARSDAYMLLLTETFPPFQDEQTRAAGSSSAV